MQTINVRKKEIKLKDSSRMIVEDEVSAEKIEFIVNDASTIENVEELDFYLQFKNRLSEYGTDELSKEYSNGILYLDWEPSAVFSKEKGNVEIQIVGYLLSYSTTSDTLFLADKTYYKKQNNDYVILVAGTDYTVGGSISSFGQTVYEQLVENRWSTIKESIYLPENIIATGTPTYDKSEIDTIVEQIKAYCRNASASATTATTKASEASASATSASSSASTATTKASEASTSAQTASTKASEASESATSASNSATTATTQAGIATTQAGVATTQAGIATTKASEASTSAQTASTAMDSAVTAKNDAISAKNSAESASSTATARAGEASTSATNASNSASTASTKASEASSSASSASTQASNSEAYAIGTRGGTDVPSTDPAYHNNAKYYAESLDIGLSVVNGCLCQTYNI